MEWSHYSIVRQKLGTIYAELGHIHLIQMLEMLSLKNMYKNSQNMITSYILLYYIKPRKQGIYLDMNQYIDEDSTPSTNLS